LPVEAFLLEACDSCVFVCNGSLHLLDLLLVRPIRVKLVGEGGYLSVPVFQLLFEGLDLGVSIRQGILEVGDELRVRAAIKATLPLHSRYLFLVLLLAHRSPLEILDQVFFLCDRLLEAAA